MWKVLKYARVGEKNREKGLLCQDYIHYMEKGTIQAITLADGTGEDNFARTGAEHSCKILAQLMVEHFDELFFMDKELIQFNIITNIQTELYRLCDQYGVDLKKLHSTLLGIVIDNSKNLFMAVHLGDGSIHIKNKEKIMTISFPENGTNKEQTFLTSSHKVAKHIKVIRDEIGDIKEFSIVSDGWNENSDRILKYIPEELFESAEKNLYSDDISFIALTNE